MREDKNQYAAIEAILFAAGDTVTLEQLSSALELDKEEVKQLVFELSKKYEDEDRGIRIVDFDNGMRYQLCTKTDYYEELIKLVNVPKSHSLTDVLLETLSIVAYKQPVTRVEIEKIRGVSSAHAVNKLVEYNLITEVGRLDAPGHPILFGTTDDFLRCFGISSMDDLPDIDPQKMADFKKEAEEEAGVVSVEV